jgi:hypothetical protein
MTEVRTISPVSKAAYPPLINAKVAHRFTNVIAKFCAVAKGHFWEAAQRQQDHHDWQL